MSELKDIALSFQCKESWDKMTSCNGGKFCQVCQKTVYDFSSFTKEEYDDFIKSQAVPFCGNYTIKQTVYHKTISFPFQKWFYGLLTILGFASCEDNSANNIPKGENDSPYKYHTRVVPVMPATDLDIPENKRTKHVTGMTIPDIKAKDIDCANIPKYKYGGEDGMMSFLFKNISLKDSVFGTVIVHFTIDKKGKVIESKIIKSLSPENDKEVLRVVNILEFEESNDTISYQLPLIIDGEL